MTLLDQGIFLGLGTNKGNREKNLHQALDGIRKHPDMQLSRVSSLYKTLPWGLKKQPWFLNAVCEIDTCLSPSVLLRELKKMEQDIGRNSPEIRWGPREIDLDIILYHNLVIETPDLCVPHKYLTERLFVLIPLLELVPEGIHPKTGIAFKEYAGRFSPEERQKSCLLYTPQMNNIP